MNGMRMGEERGEVALPSFAQAAYAEGYAVFVKGDGAEFGFWEGRRRQALQDRLQRFRGRRYRIKCLPYNKSPVCRKGKKGWMVMGWRMLFWYLSGRRHAR